MFKNPKAKIFWVFALLYVACNAFLLGSEQFLWFGILPVVAFIALLCFVALDIAFYTIVFTTPLSIWIEDHNFGVAFTLPTEPLLFGMMIVVLLKLLIEGNFDVKISRNPIFILLAIYFAWLFIACVNSTMPLVSFKYFVSQFWFVITMFFVAINVFKTHNKIALFFWVYIIPLTYVIIHTLVRHYQNDFTHKSAFWVMEPFILNHGIYGAVIAFFIPALVVGLIKPTVFSGRSYISVFFGILLVIFSLGLIFSYTRAAWISVFIAFVFYIFLTFRVRFQSLLILFFAILLTFFAFQTEIVMYLYKNKTDSTAEFSEHIKSMSNIRTDASNLERLNRWASGFRMFKEKPLLGWGPGAYVFQYAPYQSPYEKTIASTNAHDVGGIHSEYFGVLVETGLIGFIIFLSLIMTIIYRGMTIFYESKNQRTKYLALSALLGLITYLSHGTLNNYLDIDTTAVVFWAFLAMLVALDIQHHQQKTALKVAV